MPTNAAHGLIFGGRATIPWIAPTAIWKRFPFSRPDDAVLLLLVARFLGKSGKLPIGNLEFSDCEAVTDRYIVDRPLGSPFLAFERSHPETAAIDYDHRRAVFTVPELTFRHMRGCSTYA